MSKARNSETLGYLFLTLLVIALDQGFKLVSTHYFEVVKNYGIGLGLFSSQTFYLVVLGFGALAMVLLKNSLSFASALLLGGAVSNLMDRLRFGYVVDYIDIGSLPVFNLADVAIVIGAVLLVKDLSTKSQARNPKQF